MKLNGSQIVIECLVEQGVDRVFGYPGGAILNIYDELYKNQDRITHILTAHEQGASHAADGFARATGKVGVCMATSGPGATNLVTGLATAYMDSIPVVAITCNVGRSLLGKDSFQEIDICGVTKPITKHNFIVMDPKDLVSTIRQAFIIASTGRPGPVLIDIPKDITAAEIDYEPLTDEEKAKLLKKVEKEVYKREIKVSEPSEKELKKIAEIINNAKQPVIYAGGGVKISGAEKELLSFAEKAEIPVSESLMGRDVFPATHPLCTWMVGMHGTKASNMAITESDLVIAIGARFSDRVYGDASKFAQLAKVVHIDIDPSEISKNIKADGNLIGDIKAVLTKLLPLIEEKKRVEWLEKINNWKKEYPACYDIIVDDTKEIITVCTDENGDLTLNMDDGRFANKGTMRIPKNTSIKCRNINIYNNNQYGKNMQLICDGTIECEDKFNLSKLAQNSDNSGYFITSCFSTIKAKTINISYVYSIQPFSGNWIADNIVVRNGQGQNIHFTNCSDVHAQKIDINANFSDGVKIDGHVAVDTFIVNRNLYAQDGSILTIGKEQVSGNFEAKSGSIVNICYNPNKNQADGIGTCNSCTIFYNYGDKGWDDGSNPIKEGDVTGTVGGKGLQQVYTSYEDCIGEKNLRQLLGIDDDPFLPKEKEIRGLYNCNPCSKDFENTKIELREIHGRTFRLINGELIYCENDN